MRQSDQQDCHLDGRRYPATSEETPQRDRKGREKGIQLGAAAHSGLMTRAITNEGPKDCASSRQKEQHGKLTYNIVPVQASHRLFGGPDARKMCFSRRSSSSCLGCKRGIQNFCLIAQPGSEYRFKHCSGFHLCIECPLGTPLHRMNAPRDHSSTEVAL